MRTPSSPIPLWRLEPTHFETQTNYFLNHWVPNLRGTSTDKKKAQFGTEPVDSARIIFVDPRRTPTIAACEAEAGRNKVLHLAIASGTDLALFNALLTEIAAKGWVDKPFIAASTEQLDDAVKANQTTLEQAAQITGRSQRTSAKQRRGSRSQSRVARGGAPCSPTKRA